MSENPAIAELMDYAQISKYTLDDDNVKQLQLMYDATQGLALIDEARSSAKLEVEEIYARLDAELRATAAAAGEKLSETQIKMQIVLKPEMMQAERHLIDMEKGRSNWAGLVEAMKQRGYALTNLGNLYTANYFSKESVGKSRDRLDERAERARSLRPQRRGSWEG